MAQLEALEAGAFMSLCELVVMFSERMSYGMLKWSTPRVIVHIKHPQKPKKEALRG